MIRVLVNFWNKSMPLRFLVVGGWNFAFGYLAFAALYWYFHDMLPEWCIVLFSSILGITNSFIFHRWITYHSQGVWWVEYLRFYVVYGGQLVLNMVLITVFVTYLNFNAYIFQFVLNVILTVLSYWAHRFYSFRPSVGEQG